MKLRVQRRQLLHRLRAHDRPRVVRSTAAAAPGGDTPPRPGALPLCAGKAQPTRAKQVAAGNGGMGGGYGLSKCALTALTLVQAKKWPRLKVVSITPGFVDTARAGVEEHVRGLVVEFRPFFKSGPGSRLSPTV